MGPMALSVSNICVSAVLERSD